MPLIEQDNATQETTVTPSQIKNLSTRSINGLAATSVGIEISSKDLSIIKRRSFAATYQKESINLQ